MGEMCTSPGAAESQGASQGASATRPSRASATWIRAGVTLVCVLLLIWVVPWRSLWERVRGLDPRVFLAVLAGFAVIHAVGAFKWRLNVNTGKARHVFLHYPIDQLHPDAFRSHEAAACANDQGKFWALHAKLFEKPSRTLDEIIPLAQSVGIDTAALRTCVDSGKHSSEVRESVKRMQQLGIDSTPTFLIGKTPGPGQPMQILKVVKGALPYEQFKAALDPLL